MEDTNARVIRPVKPLIDDLDPLPGCHLSTGLHLIQPGNDWPIRRSIL